MNLTNSIPTSPVRFSYKIFNGSDLIEYCVSQLRPGENVVYFTNTSQNCFQAGGAVLLSTTADNLEAIQWQVPTTNVSSMTFQYCIDSLTPLFQ
jgi:hypothetical protein